MTTEVTQDIGWVITKVRDADDQSRVGWGQGLKQSEQTAESYANIFGRTIYMATDLTIQDVPYDKRVKWRSFSDDGDPAFDGVVHIDWLFPSDEFTAKVGDSEEMEDLAYNIDRFNMEDWGAVRVAYNGADIERCRPDLKDYVKRCRTSGRTGELYEHPYAKGTYFEIYG